MPDARSIDVAWGPVVAAGVAVGAASLLIQHALGYDAWAWMVWARELLHGTFRTAGGPAFKALPVIAAAPLTPFGDLAPLVWLAAMRACALLALVVAWRAGARLGGMLGGVAAAVLVAIGPDLYRTALYGSSEPLLVLLVLLAADRYLAGVERAPIALLGVAGLIRPELWPLVIVLALAVTVRHRRLDPLVVAAAVLPPVIWLGLSMAGGGASRVFHAAAPELLCSGCALATLPLRATLNLNQPTDALGVMRRLTEALVLPALVLTGVGIVVAARRRLTRPLVIACFAGAWIVIVAAMAQAGYTGSRRYLVGPAALLALLAGGGLALVVHALRDRPARIAVAVAIGVVVLVAAAPTLRSDARLVGTARGVERELSDLRAAVALAGGRRAVLAVGHPAVNPVAQTALAWDLHAPLTSVQATWNSTRRRPRWSPPAIVFRGPEHDFGPAPAIPRGRPVRRVGRAGGWLVLRS